MSEPSPSPTATATKPAKLAPLSERLARLGLVRDWDFVLHLPLRYDDLTRITPIAELTDGATAQIEGTVLTCSIKDGPRAQLTATVTDESAELAVRFLHFYPSTRKLLAKGARVRAHGAVRWSRFLGSLEMVHPKLMRAQGQTLERTLTPVYPTGERVTQHWLRKRIARALLDVDIIDCVPEQWIAEMQLPGLAEAIADIHHPKPGSDVELYTHHRTPSWQRLKFDEVLAQQVTLFHARSLRKQAVAVPLTGHTRGLCQAFIDQLPFELTAAQQRCWREVADDMAHAHPMQRLVQGDVGCGKTVVATLACLAAIDSGYQAALMAPTEILAEQHAAKLQQWLEPLGVRVAWLAGSLKAKDKAQAQQQAAAGDVDLVVGTHALIQDAVRFARLGLAVVDEQQRFGVAQRLRLRTQEAGEHVPHLLMLSATPIPRTLAMSYLSDVDISVIDALPQGRSPIVTKLVSLTRLEEVIASIAMAVAQGRQCYWVCPLIEDSPSAQCAAAQTRFDHLVERLHGQGVRVGLVHGAMSAADKAQQMAAFASHASDVLVATTVIEVGVDVPNASVMVIEQAERFGLSQLHQLRGRVGRGSAQSTCILLFDPNVGADGQARLRTMKSTTDGFVIAREDLRLRGPGELLGARQSGVPALRFVSLEEDTDLIASAKRYADQWLAQDPSTALQHAKRWFATEISFLDA